jgi:hypothetical protein
LVYVQTNSNFTIFDIIQCILVVNLRFENVAALPVAIAFLTLLLYMPHLKVSLSMLINIAYLADVS